MQFRKLEKCEVRFTFIFKDKKRRDIDNYSATVKMVMDGIVQAGILPDDDYKHLDSNDETELKLNRSDQADQLRKVIQEIQANDYKKYNRNN